MFRPVSILNCDSKSNLFLFKTGKHIIFHISKFHYQKILLSIKLKIFLIMKLIIYKNKTLKCTFVIPYAKEQLKSNFELQIKTEINLNILQGRGHLWPQQLKYHNNTRNGVQPLSFSYLFITRRFIRSYCKSAFRFDLYHIDAILVISKYLQS